MIDIEKEILSQPTSVSVDRAEVRSWIESERKQINRASTIKLAGFSLLLVCLLALVGQLLKSESQKVKQLVGTYPSPHNVMLSEITNELCGQEPAEYWINQISLVGSRDNVAKF